MCNGFSDATVSGSMVYHRLQVIDLRACSTPLGYENTPERLHEQNLDRNGIPICWRLRIRGPDVVTTIAGNGANSNHSDGCCDSIGPRIQ